MSSNDYRQCREVGFRTVRDGVRWHLVEKAPGKSDWSSWLPMLEAAEELGLQIIWDLFHYGSPDHVDQAGERLPQRFADFRGRGARDAQSVTRRPPTVCPLNEINFLSWAMDDGYFPHVGPEERGSFKHRLVQAGIASARAIKRALARARPSSGPNPDPHRAARSAPQDDPRRPGQPPGDVRGL